MLENARRQLLLVLLSVLAGLACCFTLDIPYGGDLAGGTQLRYEIPEDVVTALVTKEGQSRDKVMADTIAVITERIDPTGVLDPYITRSGDYGILIELPWFKTEAEKRTVLARIANLGKLEMRIVAYDGPIDGGTSFNLNAEAQRLKTWLQNPENKALIQEDQRQIRRYNEDLQSGPIAQASLAWYPHLIRPDKQKPGQWESPYSSPGFGALNKSVVPAYEDAEYNAGTIPEAIAKKELKDQFLIEFLAINMKEQHFTGEDLDPAGVGAGPSRRGGLGVNYRLVESKTSAYTDWSVKWLQKASAIVLNGYVRSAPVFNDKIPGRGIIEGDFTPEEVEELIKVLRTGSLRVEPELVSNQSIGPNLGAAAIRNGAWSLLAGGVLVFAFMLLYYRIAGTIACVALVLNVFLLWSAMLFMQATITLPGLAGIVLTMGMAVDANVLIYERIREELERGKDLLRAVRAGFDRAMSAILDSNITTFLVGIVLYNVGVGPVRGFAVTLMVGIVTTVFTQFFVTRLLFHFALEKNKLQNYKPRRLWADLKLDYVKWIKPAFATSIAVIVVGLALVLMAPRETVLGIDFTGGANLQMVLATAKSDEAVRKQLGGDEGFNKQYSNVSLNSIGERSADGTGQQFNVRIKLNDAQRKVIEEERKAHREARKKAIDENQAPPAPYQPPYVKELQRVFANDLVQPAFANPAVTEHATQKATLQYARIEVHFASDVDVETVRTRLQKPLAQSTVTPLGDANAKTAKDLAIEWVAPISLRAWQLAETVQKELVGLNGTDNNPVLLSDPFPSAQEMQGRLVNDLRNAAIGALILSWLLIVFYLRIRFHEYKYGIAAVVALIHDVLVALIAVVLANQAGIVEGEINLALIACFLTIIGYSVNDTIVIFDRIRENAMENVRQGKSEPFRVLINRALNQTMSRTLLTSGLTLLVVIAQFLVNWGRGSDLEGFAFAMIVGMISGVYSTIYIAAPILIWLDKGDLANPKLREAIVDVDVLAENEARAAAEAEAKAAEAKAKASGA